METLTKEKHSFFAIVEMIIDLSEEDFSTIERNMKNHYDGVVQSATKQGGFMYGQRNIRKFKVERTVHQFESREVQLMLKSLEMDHSPESYRISKRLFSIVQEATEKSQEINKQFTNIFKY